MLFSQSVGCTQPEHLFRQYSGDLLLNGVFQTTNLSVLKILSLCELQNEKMASLIPENGVIFNCADTAPPPSKDYCQVIVTWDQV